MGTKVCTKCKEEQDLSNFYFYKTMNRYYAQCKPCYNETKKRQRNDVYIPGMTNTITNKPNTYKDDVQRMETFEMMERMGWKFNSKKGIWYDNKHKDKDGNWLMDIKGTKKRNYTQRKYSAKRAETNKNKRYLPLDKIPKLNLRDDTITEEMEKKILIAYFHYCYSVTEIIKMYPEINDRKIYYIATRGSILIKKNGTR